MAYKNNDRYRISAFVALKAEVLFTILIGMERE